MLWDQIEELLRGGYHFSSFGHGWCSRGEYVYICFYSPQKKHIMYLEFSSGKNWNSEKITRCGQMIESEPKYLKSFVVPDISRQFIRFALDYEKQGLWGIRNCTEFDDPQKKRIILTLGTEIIRPKDGALFFCDFEKKETEFNEVFKEIQFPDTFAELSDIVREYAFYSFYDFLVEEFEKLEDYVYARKQKTGI